MSDPAYKELLTRQAEVQQSINLALRAQDHHAIRFYRGELTTIIAAKAIIEAIYKTRY